MRSRLARVARGVGIALSIVLSALAARFVFRGDVVAVARDLARYPTTPALWALVCVCVILFAKPLGRIFDPGVRRLWKALLAVDARLRGRGDWVLAGLLAVAAFAIALYYSRAVLDGYPHIQDEIAYHFQARLLASGRLYAPTHPLAEFFRYRFVVDDGHTYAFYTPGWPLVLALGVLLRASWIVNPLFAGVLVLLTFAIGKHTAGRPMGLLGASLVTLSPFVGVMCGTMMSHPNAAVLGAATVVFALRAARAQREGRPNGRLLVGAGCALGGLVLGRIQQAPIAATFVVLAYGIERIWPRPFARSAALLVAPVLGALVLLGAYDAALTGSPFTTPMYRYFALTEPDPTCMRIGFGPHAGCPRENGPDMAPEGFGFDRAVEVTHQRFDSLKGDLYGPGVALLLMLLPFAIPVTRRRAIVPIGGALAQVGLYFAFYYHGNAYGARYYFEAMPFFALLVAHGAVAPFSLPVGRTLFARAGRRSLAALAVGSLAFCIAAAVNVEFRGRARSLEGWNPTTTLARAAEAAHLENAVVLIPVWANLYDRRDVPYGFAFVLNPPDVTDPRAPVLYARDLGDQNAQLFLYYPDRTFYRYGYEGAFHRIPTPGDPGLVAFEGETKFPPPLRRGGYAFIADLRQYGLHQASGDHVLWMSAGEAAPPSGAFFEVPQYVFESGDYEVEAVLGVGLSFGRVRVAIDGRPIDPVFDGRADRLGIAPWRAEAPRRLARGPHRIRLTLLPGQGLPSRDGQSMALDRMTLRLLVPPTFDTGAAGVYPSSP